MEERTGLSPHSSSPTRSLCGVSGTSADLGELWERHCLKNARIKYPEPRICFDRVVRLGPRCSLQIQVAWLLETLVRVRWSAKGASFAPASRRGGWQCWEAFWGVARGEKVPSASSG